MNNIPQPDKFLHRHIGPRSHEITEMLRFIGVESTDELIDKTVPDNIKLQEEPILDAPLLESELMEEMTRLSAKNKVFKNYIGMGYHETLTPSVIRRNILENPSWYTQYTPYQAEISQGRLEALLNFQTMVSDLTGLPLSNASLLDEGTAAEAMSMFFGQRRGSKKDAVRFLVSDNLFPQTIEVLRTRAKPLGVQLDVKSDDYFDMMEDVFALIVQYPGKDGSIRDYHELFKVAQEKSINIIVAANLLSLALLKSPAN